MAKHLRHVILDRDGVINIDRPDCVHNWAELQLIDGVLDAIARLKDHGLSAAIATNQSCIGRGWVPRETVEDIHARLTRAIEEAGGAIDSIALCPHHPDAGCPCRKPAPGMLETLIQRHAYPREQCIFIGDSLKDLLAAERAAISSLLVLTGKGNKTAQELSALKQGPLHIARDLGEAVDWLINPR